MSGLDMSDIGDNVLSTLHLSSLDTEKDASAPIPASDKLL